MAATEQEPGTQPPVPEETPTTANEGNVPERAEPGKFISMIQNFLGGTPRHAAGEGAAAADTSPSQAVPSAEPQPPETELQLPEDDHTGQPVPIPKTPLELAGIQPASSSPTPPRARESTPQPRPKTPLELAGIQHDPVPASPVSMQAERQPSQVAGVPSAASAKPETMASAPAAAEAAGAASNTSEAPAPGAPPPGEPRGEAKPPPPPDENILPVKGNALYELYLRRQGVPPIDDPDLTFNLAQFTEWGGPPTEEQRGWFRSFEPPARNILQQARGEEEEPIEHVPMVRISRDRMSAFFYALPPTYGADDMTPESVMNALAEARIGFGIDELKVAEICHDKCYFTLFEVARGKPPEDGADGDVEDHFAREQEIHLQVKDDNTIDYKDLGWLQTVHEGDVICDIIPPTSAMPGLDVLGGEIRGRDGKKAVAPKGSGTRLSEDESRLLAAIDGVVTFDAGRFRVDPLLIIEGSVETATGNIETVGDVLIHGDVLEGFTVEATGNITVQGMVEGATMVAGGDIQVGRGMNGNSHGSMQAKGEVRSKFIENATVTTGGRIVCDTIINSTVSSDTAIEVKTGRGAIIGGNITALERIDALSIGNQSNRNIIITLGSTANFLRSKQELEQKRTELTRDVEEIEKNISFLDAGAVNPAPNIVSMVDDFKLKLSVQKMQLSNVERQLAQMDRKQTDNTACRLRAEIIYPPAQITIGNVTKVLRQMAFSALVYLKEGDVHVANV